MGVSFSESRKAPALGIARGYEKMSLSGAHCAGKHRWAQALCASCGEVLTATILTSGRCLGHSMVPQTVIGVADAFIRPKRIENAVLHFFADSNIAKEHTLASVQYRQKQRPSVRKVSAAITGRGALLLPFFAPNPQPVRFPMSSTNGRKPSLPTFATSTAAGLVQSYFEAESVIPFFVPRPEMLALALAHEETADRAVFLLQRAEEAARCLSCLNDGGPDALEYAAVLLRGLAADMLRQAENLGGGHAE